MEAWAPCASAWASTSHRWGRSLISPRRAASVSRKTLGTAAYTDAENRGARLSPANNEVHRVALRDLTMNFAPLPAPEPWRTLSEPQLEIAILIAAEYTNRAIAARRGVSRRTIDAQVAAIFQKLKTGTYNQCPDSHNPADTHPGHPEAVPNS
ncbi:helix-turn-helix transcriptional regulator [Streptomyces gardneri]|nr:helix-turn-helix transcriptional regulator [Streptomyces gardneri]